MGLNLVKIKIFKNDLDLDDSDLVERELDEEETQALKKFKEKDQQIDGLLDQVINNLDMMEEGLLQTKEVIILLIKFSKKSISINMTL